MFPSHEDDNTPSPYDYSDLESDDTESLFGPTAANTASALKPGDNPLNLDHTGKPLTYKTALQGPNVKHWIAANSAESAFEAEYAARFMNARHAIYLRNILEDLGYPQPPTIILCDNKCAVGIATDTAQAKRSKAIDMRWHWIRD